MTYSIVACDPSTGQIGVASQSHYFGLGRVVTFARAGVGAVATQSFVEPSYGPRGLDLMASGASAPDALALLLAQDSDADLRQVAMIDADREARAFTGSRCVPHRGQHVGDGYAVLGNMLGSDDVVPAMAAAYENATGELADRMLAALDAAEAAGGDVRGRISASLVVVSGKAGAEPWDNRLIDVRVDAAEYPLVELRRLVELSRAHTVFGSSVFTPGLLSADAPTVGAELDAALTALDGAAEVIAPDAEPAVWKGVLLARAGRVEEARMVLGGAVARHAPYRGYLDALHAVGIMPFAAEEALGDE